MCVWRRWYQQWRVWAEVWQRLRLQFLELLWQRTCLQTRSSACVCVDSCACLSIELLLLSRRCKHTMFACLLCCSSCRFTLRPRRRRRTPDCLQATFRKSWRGETHVTQLLLCHAKLKRVTLQTKRNHRNHWTHDKNCLFSASSVLQDCAA